MNKNTKKINKYINELVEKQKTPTKQLPGVPTQVVGTPPPRLAKMWALKNPGGDANKVAHPTGCGQPVRSVRLIVCHIAHVSTRFLFTPTSCKARGGGPSHKRTTAM